MGGAKAIDLAVSEIKMRELWASHWARPSSKRGRGQETKKKKTTRGPKITFFL